MCRKILIILVFLLNSAVWANNRVINTSIEEYQPNDFSIVFHDSRGDRLGINYKFSRNFLIINLPRAVEFNWNNDALYQKYIKYSVISQDRKTLSLRLMDNIKYHRMLHKDSEVKINLSSKPFEDERKDANNSLQGPQMMLHAYKVYIYTTLKQLLIKTYTIIIK